jgi:hypothetical protein
MIWNPDQLTRQPEVPEVEEIIADLSDLCGDVLRENTGKLREVATAIQAALLERDDEDIDATMLVALASRALTSIGEELAARRLVLLGSGVVRPAEWDVAGDTTVWVLDLKPLLESGGADLEMDLFTSLNRILDAIGDVWDESDGRGVLGLMHLEDCGGTSRETGKCGNPTLIAEVKAACDGKLRCLREAKGWHDLPDVISLDL